MSVLHNSLVNILPFRKLDANKICLGYETWKNDFLEKKKGFQKNHNF